MFCSRGFSLIEILIVLIITIILFSMGITSQKFLFQSSQSKIAAEKLFHAIELTRNEAIIKNKNIILCKSSISGDWVNGYLIKEGDRVLYSFHSSESEGKIYWRAFPLHREELEYLPSGSSKIENGTFWYCDSSQQNPLWAIMINQAGRAKIVYPDVNGHIADSRNGLIQC